MSAHQCLCIGWSLALRFVDPHCRKVQLSHLPASSSVSPELPKTWSGPSACIAPKHLFLHIDPGSPSPPGSLISRLFHGLVALQGSLALPSTVGLDLKGLFQSKWFYMHQAGLQKLLLHISIYHSLLQAQLYHQTIFPFSPEMLWIFFPKEGNTQGNAARGSIPSLMEEGSHLKGKGLVKKANKRECRNFKALTR